MSEEARLLTLSDVAEATEVISQSFMEDPLCAFMLPRQESRLDTLRIFFTLMSELAIRNRCVLGVGQPLQGVAFWESPGQESLSISLKSLGKFLPLLFSPYPIGYMRAKPIFKQTAEMHKKYADRPHFYLDNIGVLPSAQGKGLASKLIRPILEMADAQKVAVYTDTVTESNVGFYEHFGFENVEKSEVPKTGITVWALRRPAK